MKAPLSHKESHLAEFLFLPVSALSPQKLGFILGLFCNLHFSVNSLSQNPCYISTGPSGAFLFCKYVIIHVMLGLLLDIQRAPYGSPYRPRAVSTLTLQTENTGVLPVWVWNWDLLDPPHLGGL